MLWVLALDNTVLENKSALSVFEILWYALKEKTLNTLSVDFIEKPWKAWAST